MNKTLLSVVLIFSGLISFNNYQCCLKMKDLDFVHEQLFKNHPGFCNQEDPDFKVILQQGYQEAREEILKLYSWQDHIPVLQRYMKKFHDEHLRIYKDVITLENASNEIVRPINCQYLDDATVIIHLSTFMPNKQQEQQFQKIIQECSSFKNMKNIIFDLRHNSGGNSELGTQLLQSIFGKEYVEQQLYELYKNQIVSWRASLDNSKHIDHLLNYFSKNKELNADLLSWLSMVDEGLRKALENKEAFYEEKESAYKKPLYAVSCPIQAKIIVVIDESNISASLDFITELKALTDNIILIGHSTSADTVYMEVTSIQLPSEKGSLQYPIKMYHNRPRGNNEHYKPDILCQAEKVSDAWILATIKKMISA